MTATVLLAAAWTAYWVSPFPIEKRHPDRAPQDARPVTAVEAWAAQGEYEAAAFQLKPSAAMRRVDLRPSALKGPGGATIAADEIDVRVVKYWWRPWNSWETDRIGDLDRLELTPDMLLHDDSLVKVDEKGQVNYLRADYETGAVYLNMRERGRGSHFNYSLEPVHDAPKFVPLDLEKGRYREFFVTFHVPYGTPPGEYAGKLNILSEGKSAGSLGLKLTVYPFELPRARTHYDTTREYRFMMFNNMNLAAFLAGGKDLARAERRLRNSIAECVKHNFLHPCGPGDVARLDTDDLAVRTLLIWRECGLPCDSIVSGHAFDGKWMRKMLDGEKATPENDSAALKALIETDFIPYVDLQLAAADKYLGHRNWLFSARDEGGPDTQRRQSAFWRVVRDRGAGVFATTMGPMFRQVGWLGDMADVAARCSPTYAAGWHAGGARCVTYAGTFTGIECPDVWRRTKGIRYYFADFDGIGDYIFFREDVGNNWNGLQPTDSGYRRMLTVFPTEDGFVTTVQFEGLREAMDDVRYYSLLRMLAERAIRSGDAAKRRTGREAIAWFDSTDPEFVFDLDAFRREVAARIVRLQKLVGALPSERLKAGVAVPPCAVGRKAPDAAERSKAAGEYAKANRFDLAVPLYEAVRTDSSVKADRRVEAAVEEAKLLRATKRRDRAVAILREQLPLATSPVLRRKLLFNIFDATLTDLVFEERYSSERLAAARAVYAEVSKLTESSYDVRALFERAVRLVEASGFARQGAVARTCAEAALGDRRFDEKRRQAIRATCAIACAEAGEPKEALRFAGEVDAKGLERRLARQFFRAWAESCVSLGDRAGASRAYKELSGLYDPHGEEVAQLHKRYRKLAEKYAKPEGSLNKEK